MKRPKRFGQDAGATERGTTVSIDRQPPDTGHGQQPHPQEWWAKGKRRRMFVGTGMACARANCSGGPRVANPMGGVHIRVDSWCSVVRWYIEPWGRVLCDGSRVLPRCCRPPRPCRLKAGPSRPMNTRGRRSPPAVGRSSLSQRSNSAIPARCSKRVRPARKRISNGWKTTSANSSRAARSTSNVQTVVPLQRSRRLPRPSSCRFEPVRSRRRRRNVAGRRSAASGSACSSTNRSQRPTARRLGTRFGILLAEHLT